MNTDGSTEAELRRTVLRLFSARTQERIDWTWDQAIIQTGGYSYSRLILC